MGKGPGRRKRRRARNRAKAAQARAVAAQEVQPSDYLDVFQAEDPNPFVAEVQDPGALAQNQKEKEERKRRFEEGMARVKNLQLGAPSTRPRRISQPQITPATPSALRHLKRATPVRNRRLPSRASFTPRRSHDVVPLVRLPQAQRGVAQPQVVPVVPQETEVVEEVEVETPVDVEGEEREEREEKEAEETESPVDVVEEEPQQRLDWKHGQQQFSGGQGDVGAFARPVTFAGPRLQGEGVGLSPSPTLVAVDPLGQQRTYVPARRALSTIPEEVFLEEVPITSAEETPREESITDIRTAINQPGLRTLQARGAQVLRDPRTLQAALATGLGTSLAFANAQYQSAKLQRQGLWTVPQDCGALGVPTGLQERALQREVYHTDVGFSFTVYSTPLATTDSDDRQAAKRALRTARASGDSALPTEVVAASSSALSTSSSPPSPTSLRYVILAPEAGLCLAELENKVADILLESQPDLRVVTWPYAGSSQERHDEMPGLTRACEELHEVWRSLRQQVTGGAQSISLLGIEIGTCVVLCAAKKFPGEFEHIYLVNPFRDLSEFHKDAGLGQVSQQLVLRRCPNVETIRSLLRQRSVPITVFFNEVSPWTTVAASFTEGPDFFQQNVGTDNAFLSLVKFSGTGL